MGGENVSGKTEEGKKYGAVLRAKEAMKHERKPATLVEQGYYAAKHALQKKMREYQGP